MDVEGYDRLVELVYEAALDASHWPAFVREFETCLGGAHAILTIPHGRSPLGGIVARSAMDPEFIERYADFSELDPFHPQRWFAQARCPTGIERSIPTGTWMWSDAVISADEFRRTPFYQEYWAPLGYAAGGTLAACIDRDPEPLQSSLGLFRPRQVDAFAPHAVSLVERLLPHLRRASRLHLRTLRAGAERLALVECLDRFSEAVLLLDARGRIRVSNRAADALLRQGDALASTRDGVSACDPRAARVLCAAIARAAQLGAASAGDAGEPIPLPRVGGGRPLELLVVPIRLPGEALPAELRPCIGLFAVDPDRLAAGAPLRAHRGRVRPGAQDRRRPRSGRGRRGARHHGRHRAHPTEDGPGQDRHPPPGRPGAPAEGRPGPAAGGAGLRPG